MEASLSPRDSTSGLAPIPTKLVSTVRSFDKKVMLVLPWQKHCSPITAFCVAQLADKRRTVTMLNFGDAFVSHSRNSCADQFLKSDLDWMLTIDDDMLVPFGNAEWYRMYSAQPNYPEPFASLNALDRLMSSGKTLVGATYFGKYAGSKAVYNEAANPKENEFARSGPHDLVKPTRWVGTGCMLIHRNVFLDIEKKFPLLRRRADGLGGQWFTSSETNAMDHFRQIREFLEKGPMTGEKALKAYEMVLAAESDAKANSNLGVGEDVILCLRAKAAGHQPFIDLGLHCGHVGATVFHA